MASNEMTRGLLDNAENPMGQSIDQDGAVEVCNIPPSFHSSVLSVCTFGTPSLSLSLPPPVSNAPVLWSGQVQGGVVGPGPAHHDDLPCATATSTHPVNPLSLSTPLTGACLRVVWGLQMRARAAYTEYDVDQSGTFTEYNEYDDERRGTLR
jgi:hypothetical protein